MDLQNGSGKDALWVPGSWRARAASLLAWLSLAMATAPIGFSAFQQGLSIAGPYIAIAVVGLVLMSTNRIPPRIVALLLTSFWFMVAAFGVLTLGLGSPIMVTALAIFATLCSLFYGRLGLVLAISGVALVVVVNGVDEFFLGYVPMTDEYIETLALSPAVYMRQAVSTITAISILCVSVYFIASMQEQSLKRLHQEALQREKTERAFQAAQKAELVSQLTSGLTHNFSNALTVITTWAELLERYPDKRDYVERAARDMAQAARHATMVSREVMTLGKNFVRQREVLDPAKLLDTQIAMLRNLLPANIRLEARMDSDCFISIDRSELQQIVLNLVLNARDAIRGDGLIELSVRRTDGHVELTVRDNGTGMDEALQKRIFEPFFTTKGQDGTGLGLASIRQTVESLGGEITVDSVPGKGTTFRLVFEHETAPEGDKELTDSFNPENERKVSILLVEDEELVLRAMVTGLEDAGHNVTTAMDVEDALAEIEKLRHSDLLISDAILPGGHATQVIDAYLKRFPDCPVIVCSGYVREQGLARRLQAGSHSFLQKPVTVTQLRQRVQEVLATDSTGRFRIEGKSG